jgi:REP element-mobilizing transposase RayT
MGLSMDGPLAYFLTWNTYGTWLPGDARGWVEYGRGWKLPDPVREREAAAIMTEDACQLSPTQRVAVERQIEETCGHRRWHLYAVNCRSNHIHVVVAAHGVAPKKVRSDLKAWATRRLKTECDSTRQNWWAERGSVRHLHNEATLEAAIEYVLEAQDRKTEPLRRIPTIEPTAPIKPPPPM